MKAIYAWALLVVWPNMADVSQAQQKPSLPSEEESVGSTYQLDNLLNPKLLWALTPETVEAQYKTAGFRWLSGTTKDRGMIRPTWQLMRQPQAPSETPATEENKDEEKKTENEEKDPSNKKDPDKKDNPPTRKKQRVTIERTKLSLLKGQVQAEEVNFEFKENKLAMMTISVWNKGDSQETLNEVRFKKLLEELKTTFTGALSTRAQDLGRDPKSAAKADRVRWETADTLVQLESSFSKDRDTGFQPEFIRVRYAPKVKMALGTASAGNIAKVTRADLTSRVKKTPEGDVYVDNVPMVDQGEKGYCALATAERVMRFYGIECDQHDVAKASGGDAFGTNPQELQEALHRLQGRFKIRVRDLIHWDIKDYVKFTEVYNREAKRVGAKQCPENYFWTSFRGLDKDALREARTKGPGYERFLRHVKEATSRGVPLLWGMELGIYPENGEPARQGGGGHMRLILGYNEKNEQLLFSDSWGAGHELKRMAIKDAYVVTKGLYQIEPTAR